MLITIGSIGLQHGRSNTIKVPIITGTVIVSGSIIEGQTLTATAPTYIGIGTETWQWLRDGSPISGATSASYLQVAADVGHALVAHFAVTNSVGSAEASSAPTAAVEDVILNTFASGLNGFWLDAAASSRLYQLAGAGNVWTLPPSVTTGDFVGIAIDQHLPVWNGPAASLADVLAVQSNLVVNGDFATNSFSGWSTVAVGAATVDASTGKAVLTGGGSGNQSSINQVQTVSNGGYYYITADVVVSSGNIGVFIGSAIGAADRAGGSTGINRSLQAIFKTNNSVNNTYNVIVPAWTNSQASVDNFVLKFVPGNHALQTTTGARPTFQAGPVLRTILDDNLLTNFIPGLKNTLFYLGKLNADSDVALGAKASSNGNIWLGTDALGRIAGGVGSDGTSVIHGNNDVRSVRDVYTIRNDGLTVDLWEGINKVYSASQNGTPTTTIPMRIMALNDNGSGAAFLDGDGTVWLAFADALADWRVNAIIKKLRSRI